MEIPFVGVDSQHSSSVQDFSNCKSVFKVLFCSVQGALKATSNLEVFLVKCS